MLRSIGGKGSKMKKTFLLILILPFSVVFGKSVVEISAEIIINPPDERKIHATPHLLNIALHGHSLPQDQKDALIVKGFSFDGPLVNRTAMVRSEANGLDASLDYGNLRFHYTTSGSNGVDPTDGDGNSVPDYVDSMAAIFSDVWTYQLTTLGYNQPPSDGTEGGSSHYDIYIRSLGAGLYGYVQSENWASGNGDNENSSETETLAVTSYMAMQNSYTGFAGNTEIENIKVTAAHEFFHAVQFGYDAYEKGWVLEASAVWMEEEMYNDVNDCYQYMTSWFAYPATSLDESGSHWYGSFIFFQYIDEHMGGSEPIRRMYEIGVSSPSNTGDFSHDDIDAALDEQGFTFKGALNGMAVANFVLSSNSGAGDYSYQEADEYLVSSPGIFASISFKEGMDTSISSTSLNRYATEYISLTSNDPIKCTITPSSSNAEDLVLHAILETSSGSVTVISESNESINIDPANYDRMGLAIVSQDTMGGDWDYSVSFENGLASVTGTSLQAGEIRIDSNYPNPFNGTTAFQINVAETQRVKVTMVNGRGHTVRTVFHGTAAAGGTVITWDGRMDSGKRAPSGLYIVNAIGTETTAAEKILYLK